MNTFSLLMDGFSSILNPLYLSYCMFGVVMGTIIGVLPGLGPSSAIAMLLPIVYGKDPLASLIILSGMFYGAAYGGTITAVLINVPGEASSAPTTFDGYPLAKKGQAGIALGIGAIASWFSATLGLVLLTLVAIPLARFGLKFGPPEYFTVMLFAFVAVSTFVGKSLLKSFLALFLGLLLATVGFDVQTGIPRLTWGIVDLWDGIKFITAVIGLFGLSEIVYNLVNRTDVIGTDNKTKFKLRDVFPRFYHIKECISTIIRGSILGFFVGVLPGAGANIASFLTYGLERRISKNPEKWGTGVIQGVAAPESANNGSCSGSFVPLLALGIPGSGTTAVILGAFILLGLQPGPRMFTDKPEVVWGLIASMYIGNIMLLFLNTLFIPFFVWVLKVSHKVLPIVVSTLFFLGVFSLSRSMCDVWLMLLFGVLGYAFKMFAIPPAPVILALILGGKAEYAFRQSLILSMGSPTIFITRPISAVLLLASLLLLLLPIISRFLQRWKARN